MYVEPDTEQNAEPRQIEAELFGRMAGVNESDQVGLRFGLAELLIATAAAAGLFALFRAAGTVGAAMAFVAALVFTLGLYPHWQRSSQRQARMFDFLWGMVMPLVCLALDPIVFKWIEPFPPEEDLAFVFKSNVLTSHVRDGSFIAYGWIAWQIVALGLTLSIGRIRGAWASIFAGTLLVGACLAALIGVVLIPLATIGLVVFIGVLGYTPLLTAYAFARNFNRLARLANTELSDGQVVVWGVLGSAIAILLPIGTGLLLLAALRGPDWHLLP